MHEAGFINIRKEIYKWPINTWPKREKEKKIGMWNLQNVLQGLQGFSRGLFTRVLGWSPERVELYLMMVRRDLQNRRIHPIGQCEHCLLSGQFGCYCMRC